MRIRCLFSTVVALFVLSAGTLAQTRNPASSLASANPLEQVAYIHGMPGPFAVAGYRIGERALRYSRLL